MDLRTDLERHDDDRPRGKQVKLGPSNIGRCLRQDAFRTFDIPKTDEQSRGKARLGSLLHLGYGVLAEEAGRESEVTIAIPGLGDGHADDVDRRRRVVTDLKTAGDRAFQRYVTFGLPDTYWHQVELYAYGLVCAEEGGTPRADTVIPITPWTLRVILLNRETGEEEAFEREADPDNGAYLAEVLALRQRLLDLATSPYDIAREGGGPGTGFPCDYCDWATACWGEPDGDLSPQAQTIVDDPEAIAQVLEDYLAASAEASKLEKAKKEARVFLTGIPPGDYGKASLKWQGGNDLGDEPDAEAMAEMLHILGYDIPTKRKTSAKSIRVSRRKHVAAKTAPTDTIDPAEESVPDVALTGTDSTVISAGPDGE